MKNIVKLLVAIVFGAVAAGLNWFWMTNERDYPSYVVASAPIEQGDTITLDSLQAVPIKGEAAELNRTLVPWSERFTWVNRAASREYKEGDPLFQRDLVEATGTAQWDTLGPFTLIGVGSERTVAFGAKPGEVIPTSGNVLTLAIGPDQLDEKNLLYRYIGAMRDRFYFNESDEERALLEIIGIEPEIGLEPPDEAELAGGSGTDSEETLLSTLPTTDPSQAALLKDHLGDHLMFVSLEEIPNAPSFLRIGEKIHFIVPPGKDRLLNRDGVQVAGDEGISN